MMVFFGVNGLWSHDRAIVKKKVCIKDDGVFVIIFLCVALGIFTISRHHYHDCDDSA